MKKINLPTTKNFPAQNRWLSMNEYIKFINFAAAHFPKQKNSKTNEIKMLVNVPFSIK
jgi:hypothetical protein